MRKGTWIGGLALVLGLGYIAGVYVSGEQAKVEYERFVAALSENYRGMAKVSAVTNSSLLSTESVLQVEFQDLPEPLLEWMGENKIAFDVNLSHGFLATDSVIRLAESEFLEKLKSHQKLSNREPLVITANYKYDLLAASVSIQGFVDLAGFNYADGQIELAIGSAQGPYSVEGDRLELALNAEPSQLKLEGIVFDIGATTFRQDAQAINGDILAADMAINSKASVDVEKFVVSGPGVDVSLDALALKAEQQIEDDRAVIGLQYYAKSLNVVDVGNKRQFDEPQVEITLDMDFAAVVDFAKGLQDLQQEGSGSIENPMDILPLLNGVTGKGLGLAINRLGVTYQGEALTGNADLKLAPFAIEELMQDRNGAIQKADLKAHLMLPKKLLEIIPGYDSSQLGFAVSMGFLIDEESHYRFDLEANKGELSVNGKALPM